MIHRLLLFKASPPQACVWLVPLVREHRDQELVPTWAIAAPDSGGSSASIYTAKTHLENAQIKTSSVDSCV